MMAVAQVGPANDGRDGMSGYFNILGAIPGFFLSSLFVWLLWDPVARRVGWDLDLSYVEAMLVTITLWLAVAPLAAVRRQKKS